MGKSLLDKVWDAHTVRELPSGQTQLFIGLHLVHEVTSPQAFQMMREQGFKLAFPERTFATVDHIMPTDTRQRPYSDAQAEGMMGAIERNCREFGIRFFDVSTGHQGIVHVLGPELGLTQPGMTVACGDSHTSTHGAFGALAFGIGTSEVEHVLATQTLPQSRPRTMQVRVHGLLGPGVTAKDLALGIIGQIGTSGATGHVVEYAGKAVAALSMPERMTLCNMSIESGARAGMVAPDNTTFAWIRGRRFAPPGPDLAHAIDYWRTLPSDDGAEFDTTADIDAAEHYNRKFMKSARSPSAYAFLSR